MKKYFRGKIIKCSDNDFWYKGNINWTYLMRMPQNGGGAYYETSEGYSVLVQDVRNLDDGQTGSGINN